MYVAEGLSHAVRAVSYSVAFLPLLPCRERTLACATDPVLLEWKHQQYHPTQVQSTIPAQAVADSRPNSGTGSRLFEINIWMWCNRRIFPQDVTVADAVAMRKQQVEESRALGAAILQCWRMQAQARAAGAQ